MSVTPAPPLPPPPPMPSAPVYLPSPFGPHARGGFTRAILTALAVSVFGFSLTLNVYLLLFSGVLGGGPVTKTIVRAGDAKSLIAVVPVHGTITGASAAELNQLLGEAENDPALKAIVLEINTRGGEVTSSDQMHARVLKLREQRKVPVVVSMGAYATSGGYYVACAADAIVAQRTTWTGNIGVIWPRVNVHELADKYGVRDTTLASTGATFKDAGSSLKPETPEQKAYWQGLIDEAFVTFKDVVAKGRGLDARTVDRVADGRAFSARTAQSLKLIDAIGYLDDAIDLAAQRAGLPPASAHVVRYERKPGLFEAFSPGGSDARLPVGGVSVSVDAAAVAELTSPRPLYLWRGQ